MHCELHREFFLYNPDEILGKMKTILGENIPIYIHWAYEDFNPNEMEFLSITPVMGGYSIYDATTLETITTSSLEVEMLSQLLKSK